MVSKCWARLGYARLGKQRLGYLSVTTSLLVYSHPVTSLPLSYYWFVLIPLQVPFHSKMGITSKMYCHYKSSYIQFLTLGRSHDRLYKPSKFPFLASHMTCLPKQPTSLHFLLLVSHMACLYKPLSFPFLIGHITCLSKHLIPPTNFLF